MDGHKLAAIIGIVVLALGVLILLPLVSDKVGTGKATADDVLSSIGSVKLNENFNSLATDNGAYSAE